MGHNHPSVKLYIYKYNRQEIGSIPATLKQNYKGVKGHEGGKCLKFLKGESRI